MAVFERILWYISIPASVLFVIQMIMTFIGIGGESGDIGDCEDAGGDFRGDNPTFAVFTVRNFIIFFTVFGWCGITLYNAGVSEIFTVLISTVVAIIVMFIVVGLFYGITRLAQNGTMNINYAKGKVGEVYIPIPAKKSGVGKVHITLQGALREVEAITEGKSIPRGAIVKVVDVINNNLLLVE